MTAVGHTPATLKATPKWTCCQLGAREHYAIPRALYLEQSLDRLLTDIWAPPQTPWGHLPKRRWRERYTADLRSADVVSWNGAAAASELFRRVRAWRQWDVILDRNLWFQNRVIQRLSADSVPPGSGVLFAYSYAAEKPFQWAKDRGLQTVLGQIDPGPVEEQIVARLHGAAGQTAARWAPAPSAYWQSWKTECNLADRIVVNSEWSRAALVQEGVPSDKIVTIPLAFDPPREARTFLRQCSGGFTQKRPLRALFLGQANLRKGMGLLLAAMRRMALEPVEFWIVGPSSVTVPADLRRQSKIKWFGHVPRSRVAWFYRNADVFLFPTFSDGFGMTQLEAQAWRLPLVASRFCGDVVVHEKNGILLDELTGESIAASLTGLLQHPSRLAAMSAASGLDDRFTLGALGRRLLELADR